jgi:branched-chain amino acid aminotransferase
MGIAVSIDGRVTDAAGAQVSVFDRGFLYGDSVYEVTRTAGGHPVDEERHLERLARSAERLLIPCPPVEQLVAETRAALAAAGNAESYVRTVLTRGAGEIGLDMALAVDPKRIVIVQPLKLPPAELYARGCDVVVAKLRRNPREALDPAVKSGNYLNNILALAEARRAGAHECLMLNPAGDLVEGSTSNVFLVRGGRVITPALEGGLLAGITRRRVLELCAAAGVLVEERRVAPDELAGADEVFLSSSIRGVLPVARVDGRAVGGGAPGPIGRELVGRYAAFLEDVARGV